MPRRDVDEWFVQVGREMGLLSEELAGGRPRLAGGMAWEPRVDLFEEPSRLLIRAELAGVRAEDVSLHYVPERHSIVIRGTRVDGGVPADGRRAAHLLEIPMGEFGREVRLPAVRIEAEGIKASFRHGMLLVSVPRVESVIVVTTTYTEVQG